MKLVDRVKEFLDEKCKIIVMGFYTDIINRFEEFEEEQERSIESPVEQLFYIEWTFRQFCNKNLELLYLEPQHQDPTTEGFIIDFYVNLLEEVLTWEEMMNSEKSKIIMSIPHPKLGIEIDGHIWHEKTKEQVMRDKKRERKLIANGWKLLRFSGTEVFKDPTKCVEEAINISLELKEKYFKELKAKLKQKK